MHLRDAVASWGSRAVIVLLVEDDDDFARRLVEATAEDGSLEFHRAASKRGAEELLDRLEHVDLVICDLRILAHDAGLDRSPEHGLAVHAVASRRFPGAPTIFLTGVAEANIDDLSEATSGGGLSTVLGDGKPLRMVQLFRKDRTRACVQEILNFASRLRSLDAMPVECEAELAERLDPMEYRAVRLAARQWNGSRAVVKALGGGLSGSQTLQAQVFDGEVLRASVFLKIDGLATCRDEAERFRSLVVGTISHHAFPALAHNLEHCMGRLGCLVYKFADDWRTTLFGALRDATEISTVSAQIRTLLSSWDQVIEIRTTSVAQLRERVIPTSSFEAALRDHAPDVQDLLALVGQFENERIDVTFVAQHGDLHGENILCSAAGGLTLIDAGDVGMHPPGLDPASLEISLICHPNSPIAGGSWPSPDEAAGWANVDDFVVSCPYPDLVRELRLWAMEVAGPLGLKRAAYISMARQLKYPETPKEAVVNMLRAVLQLP